MVLGTDVECAEICTQPRYILACSLAADERRMESRRRALLTARDIESARETTTWSRRGWLVMLRAHHLNFSTKGRGWLCLRGCKRARDRGDGFQQVVIKVIDLEEEGVFRHIVMHL